MPFFSIPSMSYVSVNTQIFLVRKSVCNFASRRWKRLCPQWCMRRLDGGAQAAWGLGGKGGDYWPVATQQGGAYGKLKCSWWWEESIAPWWNLDSDLWDKGPALSAGSEARSISSSDSDPGDTLTSVQIGSPSSTSQSSLSLLTQSFVCKSTSFIFNLLAFL